MGTIKSLKRNGCIQYTGWVGGDRGLTKMFSLITITITILSGCPSGREQGIPCQRSARPAGFRPALLSFLLCSALFPFLFLSSGSSYALLPFYFSHSVLLSFLQQQKNVPFLKFKVKNGPEGSRMVHMVQQGPKLSIMATNSPERSKKV